MSGLVVATVAVGAGAQAPAVQQPHAAAMSAQGPVAERAPGREVLTKPADTLWRIASNNLPQGAGNIQQYMLSILQENPQAFVDGNINGLMAGFRLRLPEAVAELSPKEAIQETSRQNAAWQGGAGRGQGELKVQTQTGDQATGRAGAGEGDASPDTPNLSPSGADAPPPEANLSQTLDAVRQQLLEQADRLQRQELEIAELGGELVALRAALKAERQAWAQELAWWRIAAIASALALALIGALALRWRRMERRATDALASGQPMAEHSDDRTEERLEDPQAQHPEDGLGVGLEDPQTKINLAKAHIDLGKMEEAREILEEVLAQGADAQREEAEALLRRTITD